VYLIGAKGLPERRDERGPYYESDELEAWIAANKWTGPRFKRPTEHRSHLKLVHKGLRVAEAMQMIRDGHERAHIIITLRCPIAWIDEAYEEIAHTFESAQERLLRMRQQAELEAERREAERAQRALEKAIRDDTKRRRKK